MNTSASNTTKRNRWMDWQPKARVMTPSGPKEPSEPSKPSFVGFVGFVGCPPSEISITRGGLPEQVAPCVDTTEPANSGMPSNVRILSWSLKEPPVLVETHAVVTNPPLFAEAALGELRERLTNPRRRLGRPVAQLIDHLEQVGVRIAIDREVEWENSNSKKVGHS